MGQVKAIRDKIHDYLAMNLDFTVAAAVKIDMVKYVKEILDDFTEEVTTSSCPRNGNLFKVDHNSPKLSKAKSEQCHTFVAKGLFVCKRARIDIQPAIAFL